MPFASIKQVEEIIAHQKSVIDAWENRWNELRGIMQRVADAMAGDCFYQSEAPAFMMVMDDCERRFQMLGAAQHAVIATPMPDDWS